MAASRAFDPSRRQRRIRRLLASVLIAIALLAVRPAGAPLDMRLHVDASLRTNAVYHLACLGGSIACSREIFERFWRNRLDESDTDRQTVTAWQRLLASAVERAPAMKPSPLLINAVPLHPDGLTRRQVIAGLIETGSAAALVRRAPVLSPAEARELIGLVDRVERRLRPWWRAEGERSASARIRGVVDTARRNDAMEALGRMAEFLESAPPDENAYVHAIAPPEPESEDYTATAILNHLPIEVVAAASDPNDIVEGVVHELGHYLYDYIPPDRHLALVNEFVASDAPSVAGMYSYLHEAMAISAQGLYGDALDNGTLDADDPDSGYKHPYIPALADVALPLVRAAVARDEHLVGGFSRAYIDGVLSSLGDRRNELPFVFAQTVLVTTSGNRELADAFERTLFPVSSVRFDDLARAEAFPDTNLVQLATYAELGDTAEPEVLRLRGDHSGFAYALPRGRGGYHLTVAGRSDQDVLAVIGKLTEVVTFAGPGLVVGIE